MGVAQQAKYQPLFSRANYLRIAAYFLSLGATGFGGPIALSARMRRELVEELGWITADAYADGLAFAQLAPGPLAAQLAMYLGYEMAGVAGCTVAGVAFVLPSFVMVIAISIAYVAFGGLPVVQSTFRGVAPVVIAIIAIAAWKLGKKVIKQDRLLLGIAVVVAVWTAVSQQELVVLFIASGVVVAFARIPLRSGTSAISLLSLPTAGASTSLFLFFAKAGLFVFGSGLAIVPFLYGGVVHDHHWLTEQQFVDAVAIAMITPGPVVITVAFIGYLVDGLKGATLAALGIFAPVYLMVVVLAPAYRRFSGNQTIRAFVSGVTAAACGGIAGSVLVLARRSVHDSFGCVLLAITLVILVRWKLPEPLVIAIGSAAGLSSQLFIAR